MASIRQRQSQEIEGRKQRISALDQEKDDEKEIEEIREEISLNAAQLNLSAAAVSLPMPNNHQPTGPVQPALQPISNGTLLPHTQASSMSVLTPTQSSAVEEKKKEGLASTINLAEFESYSTNPFEEMELKTLNDKEELALLLQPPGPPPPPSQPSYALQYQSYGNPVSTNPTSWPEALPRTYQPAIPQHLQHYTPTPAANWIIHHQSLEQEMQHVSLHQKSSVPGSGFPQHHYQGPPLSGILRQAKSVPDLSADAGASSPVSTVFPPSSDNKRLSSRTPPPRLTSESIPKPFLPPNQHINFQSQWEKNLNPAEKVLVQQLHSMGFPRDGRVPRTIGRLGANQKDVVDQLLTMQKLEDSGYAVQAIESALDLLKPGEELPKRLEQHLQLTDQLSALGFDKGKIGAALVAAGHDRDKALDILLMM